MPFKPIKNYKVTYAKDLEQDLNSLFSRRSNNSSSTKSLSYRRLLKKINNLEDDMLNGNYKLSKQSKNKLGREYENIQSFLLDTQKSLQKILNEIEKSHEKYLDDIKDLNGGEILKTKELYYKNAKELFWGTEGKVL